MVVAQVAELHTALGQYLGELRRPAEGVCLLRAVGFERIEHIFQVDDGDIVLRQNGLHLFKGIGVAVLLDIAVKGGGLPARALLAAQGAIPREAEQDVCPLLSGLRVGQYQAYQQQKHKAKTAPHLPLPSRQKALNPFAILLIHGLSVNAPRPREALDTHPLGRYNAHKPVRERSNRQGNQHREPRMVQSGLRAAGEWTPEGGAKRASQ